MSDQFEPPRAPLHRCINAECGCTDLISAGPCSIWCAEHTVEVADLKEGHPLGVCECMHEVCSVNMPRRSGVVPTSEHALG